MLSSSPVVIDGLLGVDAGSDDKLFVDVKCLKLSS